MDIKIDEHIIKIVTIAPHSRIDAFNAPKLREALNNLLDNGVQHLILDLSETPFMDSAGMAALVNAYKRGREIGGSIKMVWPQKADVKRILKLTKFDRVFDMVDTVEEGRAQVTGVASGM